MCHAPGWCRWRGVELCGTAQLRVRGKEHDPRPTTHDARHTAHNHRAHTAHTAPGVRPMQQQNGAGVLKPWSLSPNPRLTVGIGSKGDHLRGSGTAGQRVNGRSAGQRRGQEPRGALGSYPARGLPGCAESNGSRGRRGSDAGRRPGALPVRPACVPGLRSSTQAAAPK